MFVRLADLADIPTTAFFSVPLVAGATVFAFAALGLYLLTQKNFSPKISSQM